MGIRVQIHNQEEPPAIDQLGFGAAPGHQTFVSCQQQQVCRFNCLCLLPPQAPALPRRPSDPKTQHLSLTLGDLCNLVPPTAEFPATSLG